MTEITRATSAHEDFIRLVRLLDADLNGRYGQLQAEYDQYNKIEDIGTVVISYADGNPVGCGAFKPFDEETVEIKRMFVQPEYRGKGLAGRMLRELEAWAKKIGFSRSVLETGKKQVEAIGLYEKHGYRRIPNYGQYIDQPNSVCFEKMIP